MACTFRQGCQGSIWIKTWWNWERQNQRQHDARGRALCERSQLYGGEGCAMSPLSLEWSEWGRVTVTGSEVLEAGRGDIKEGLLVLPRGLWLLLWVRWQCNGKFGGKKGYDHICNAPIARLRQKAEARRVAGVILPWSRVVTSKLPWITAYWDQCAL